MRKIILAASVALLTSSGDTFADTFPSHPSQSSCRFLPAVRPMRWCASSPTHEGHLGETLLIENVTGAGGSLGVGRAVHAPPDGYTISFGHLGTHVANGAIYKLGYDLVADLEPVVLLPSNPMIIVSRMRFRRNR